MISQASIEPWSLSHLDSLVRHADNPNIAKLLRDRFPHPYREEDGRAFISRNMSEDPARNFAIVIDGEAVGSIGLMLKNDVHSKNAEIGYWIAQPYWGRGIVSSLLQEVIIYGFEHFDINRIYAVVSHRNLASCKVLEKNGFILEARFAGTLFKNGEYHDELIFAIRK